MSGALLFVKDKGTNKVVEAQIKMLKLLIRPRAHVILITVYSTCEPLNLFILMKISENTNFQQCRSCYFPSFMFLSLHYYVIILSTLLCFIGKVLSSLFRLSFCTRCKFIFFMRCKKNYHAFLYIIDSIKVLFQYIVLVAGKISANIMQESTVKCKSLYVLK